MSKIGIIKKARNLRREDTEAEKILWKELRGHRSGVKWRRQHPVDMYILDFFSPKINVGIELDGSIHNIKANKEYDNERTKYLRKKGIKILRFWNSEVEKDLSIVLEIIRKEIELSLF